MNKYGRILYTTKVDNMKSMGDEVNVGVYGIFTTSSSGNGNWKYYLISYKKQPNSNLRLTSEWHSYSIEVEYINSLNNDSFLGLTRIVSYFINDVLKDPEIYKMWYKWKNT